MHYKGFVITKEIPTQERLEKILSKYNYEGKNNNSGFTWDWYQIGGRYGAGIKINANQEKFEWNYLSKIRNHKYFIVNMLDEIKEKDKWFEEYDYLMYMGLKDDVLYVDGAYYEDIIDFDITSCFLVIEEDDYINVRENWGNSTWNKNEQFDEEVKQIDLKGKFITIIDFHD